MSSNRSRSIIPLFEAVVDKTKQRGKALENMGVNRQEIHDVESFAYAAQQYASQAQTAAKALGAIAARLEGVDGGEVKKTTDNIVKAINQFLDSAKGDRNIDITPKTTSHSPEYDPPDDMHKGVPWKRKTPTGHLPDRSRGMYRAKSDK